MCVCSSSGGGGGGVSEVNTMEAVISDGGHLIPQKPAHAGPQVQVTACCPSAAARFPYGVNCAGV